MPKLSFRKFARLLCVPLALVALCACENGVAKSAARVDAASVEVGSGGGTATGGRLQAVRATTARTRARR